MTHDEKLALLTQWDACYQALDAKWERMRKTLNATVDSPDGDCDWLLFEHYTAAVSALIGDDCDWLNWYRWERPAHDPLVELRGVEYRVNTMEDLLTVIERSNDGEL